MCFYAHPSLFYVSLILRNVSRGLLFSRFVSEFFDIRIVLSLCFGEVGLTLIRDKVIIVRRLG